MQSEEELIYSTEQQARRNVRRVKSGGLELEMYDTPTNENFEIFWQLYLKLHNY